MKLIIGAGGKKQDGWISTEQSQLDLFNREDFARVLMGAVGYECILMEHVLEHIPQKDMPTVIKNCFDFLSINGRLRIAVPDGYHPDKEYIDYVKPGGTGAGADSHTVLFNYLVLTNLMENAGFKTVPLEWWDEHNMFHASPWNEIDGNIERCLANDPRNRDGKPHYTSLIMDGIKENDLERPHLKDAFAFIEEKDVRKLSPFNRKKTTSFYELARLAPAGGVIIEIGAYHGMGTSALWYGARDGHRCEVIAIDPYEPNIGWAGEYYGPEDKLVWEENMKWAKIYPKLHVGWSEQVAKEWKKPVSLAMLDIPILGQMPKDVADWERHVIIGGLIALRDIDNFSMGTEKAISNLISTGNWGNRRNWDGFITSIERIK